MHAKLGYFPLVILFQSFGRKKLLPRPRPMQLHCMKRSHCDKILKILKHIVILLCLGRAGACVLGQKEWDVDRATTKCNECIRQSKRKHCSLTCSFRAAPTAKRNVAYFIGWHRSKDLQDISEYTTNRHRVKILRRPDSACSFPIADHTKYKILLQL